MNIQAHIYIYIYVYIYIYIYIPESVNDSNTLLNVLSNIEQDTLVAVPNDLNVIEHNNVQIIPESDDSEMLHLPQSPLVGCDSDSE